MKYRREVDGLRAVAVLPVVLFHAKSALFSGGYVGVDVFFVISGFLITTIIANELDGKGFSIRRFYERRARRILPALFTVMLVSIPFAWWILSPTQFLQFGQSLVAVILFASNILFWRKTDYFDSAAEEKPLLHTWSLAVEEQYYVFVPLILIAVWRFGNREWALRIVVAMAIVSFIMCIIWVAPHPAATFYLIHTRAWELFAGSICALIVVTPSATRDNILSGTGLAMIVLAVLLLDEHTPFPSAWTLLPVVGTALILVCGREGTLTARILGFAPFVWIGLISYSLYLWHQPIFAFARVQDVFVMEPAHYYGLILLAIAAAWLTWYFIEQPFRRPVGEGRMFRSFFWGAPVLALGFVLLGVYGHVSKGAPARFSPEAQRAYADAKWDSNCLWRANNPHPDLPIEKCISNPGADKRVAIYGDSVAASLSPQIIEQFVARGYEVHQLTHGNCLPLRDVRRNTFASEPCHEFVRTALDYIERGDFDLVVIAGMWDRVIEDLDKSAMDDSTGEIPDRAKVTTDLRETLEAFDTPVLVVYPHPTADRILRDVAIRMVDRTGALGHYDVSIPDFMAMTRNSRATLDAAMPSDAIIVRPKDVLCDEASGECALIAPDAVLISDEVHYTHEGARRMAEYIISRVP